MIVFLEVTPRWPIDADPISLCSAADRRAQSWDSKRWAAALFDPGVLSVALFNGEIGSELESGSTPVVIAEQAMLELFPDAIDVRWEGAAFEMWAGDFASPPGIGSYPYANTVEQVARGKVTRFEKEEGAIKLTLDPAGVAGDTKVMDREYAGTGGAEGGPDLKGALKPWVFGVAKNVEPVLINEDDSVYQFSGYGPIEAVDDLYERGSSFGPSTGDYANYAALVAATIPAGRWATCLAQGMIRLGAPQYGVITGDVKGDNSAGFIRRAGAILQRIADERSIASDTIDTASLDALDAFAATLPQGGYINLVLTEQTTFKDLARRLCAPFNAQAGYTLMGELIAPRLSVGTPSFTIDARGRRIPLVGAFIEGDTPPPYKRIVMAGETSWRVHSLSTEIAFYATPVERGIYDDAETYREGDITSISDGSRWIYTNPVPSAGNDPVDGSSYWARLSEPATGPEGPPGAPGSSIASVFKRSATQPSTPSPGITFPPSGWYADVASVPADDDPLWSSIGSQTDPESNWLWNVPVQIEGQDGAPGTDGAPGAPGSPGTTYYTWYAYADAPDGTFNFTTGSPGNRQFQGVAYNKTTATESTNPADYTWSDYIGPPNFGLAAFNSNSVVAGNKLIKVAGGDGAWNASVHSTESFKNGASVTFVVDNTAEGFMVGLSSDPTTDASYTSIDFAIQIYPDGGTDVAVYEDGIYRMAMAEAYAAGDTFTVTYNGKSVVYSKNGSSFYTNPSPPPDLTLFLDSSLNTEGHCGRILSFTAAGTAGDDGAPGEDGADGTDGRGIDLSAPALSFAAYDDGSLKPGEIDKTSKATFLSGGTDVSAATTWTIQEEIGCDASISSTGLVSFSSVTSTGSVKVRGVYGGTTIDKTIAITFARDPAPPQTPLSQSTNIVNGSGVNASFPASPTAGILTVTTDADGDMRVKVAYEYNVQDAGSAPSSRSLTLAAQIFYRPAGSGGSWTAWLGAEQGGTNATAIINSEGELTNTPGTISINDTKTSLSANTAYELWFAHRKTSGSGTTWLMSYLLFTAEAL